MDSTYGESSRLLAGEWDRTIPRLGWLLGVRELRSRTFKPLPEDLDVFAHHPLLGVEQILVLAWQLREGVGGHESVQLVQASGGFLRLSEETGSLFFVHCLLWFPRPPNG